MSDFRQHLATAAVCVSCSLAAAQSADLNGDATVNCRDVELLQAEILSGQNDPSLDLDGDGEVTRHDVDSWLSNAGHELGFGDALNYGDINLDGVVDEADANVMGIGWQRPIQATGWCQADLDGNQFVDGIDNGYFEVNWYSQAGNAQFRSRSSNATKNELPHTLDAWRSNRVVFLESDYVEFVAIPQRAPDGLLATTLVVQTKSPTDRIVTFYDLAFTGTLHQTWYPVFQMIRTPKVDDFRIAFFSTPDEWREADSHMLIPGDVVGVNLGSGFAGISEENDLSNVAGKDEMLPAFEGVTAQTGIGDLTMYLPVDGFFLRPFAQTSEVAVAHLTTPAAGQDTEDGQVFLRLGILGTSENDDPWPYEGVVGFDEPIVVPFFSEPCDFDADGRCDVSDLNRLLSALASAEPDFDLVDDSLVDLRDRDAWLIDAGNENIGTAYVLGDTDLDGDVDAADLNNLGIHWQQFGSFGWGGGDFDGSQDVNGVDLNALAVNWQHGVSHATLTVPEANSFLWLGLFACLLPLRLTAVRER